MNQDQKSSPDYQAQAILSRRDHSEYEIRSKLKQKKFTADQINQTIDKLKKLDLVNDQKFALAYAQSIINAKPVGRRWVEHKLRQRGLASSIISSVIIEIFTISLEQKLAHRAAANWRRLHPQPAADKSRLDRHLASRGFSYDIISSIDSTAARE